MTDVALVWNPGAFGADIALDGAIIRMDGGLRTAVIISLFTDARAAPDDVLPVAGGDRRGWWGDAYPTVEGDMIGSKLWLLSRSKQTTAVVDDCQRYAAEALKWLVDAGVASKVDVVASVPRMGWLSLAVSIFRGEGPTRDHFDFVWENT